MIITTTKASSNPSNQSNNGATGNTGYSLSSTTLGFLSLLMVYPSGMEALLKSSLNATRTAKMTRIASITCIYALATNLLEEYRTNREVYEDEDHSPTLQHHKPLRRADIWNPVAGAALAGAVIQAKNRSILKMLKASSFFGVGMAAYCLGLEVIDPFFKLKSWNLFDMVERVVNPTGFDRK